MEINKVSNDTRVSMKKRVITGIFIAIIGIPALLFGDWFYVALIIFLTAVGTYEMLHITGKKYPWYIWVTIYIFVFTFVFWVFFQRQTNDLNRIAEYVPLSENHKFLMWDIRISTMGFAFLIALLITYSIISHKIDIHDVFYLFSMSLFVGITMQSMLFLRFSPQSLATVYEYETNFHTVGLIGYVIAGVFLNDIFAYFVGVLFGKHKMAPIISPKKTWEGFFGGVILSTIFTVTVTICLDVFLGYPILDGILDAEHWYYVILISLLMAVSGVIGDLMFSLIKRSYNIKDFGNIFPGHGGVLDRFDSTLITALLVSILIIFIYYNPLGGAIPPVLNRFI